jgi:hypothetical protein
MCDEKILYQLPTVEYTFFDCHLSFFLCKAAMNAPHLCKLRKGFLNGIGHGAIVLIKCLHFLIFQMQKAEQILLRTYQLRRD